MTVSVRWRTGASASGQCSSGHALAWTSATSAFGGGASAEGGRGTPPHRRIGGSGRQVRDPAAGGAVCRGQYPANRRVFRRTHAQRLRRLERRRSCLPLARRSRAASAPLARRSGTLLSAVRTRGFATQRLFMSRAVLRAGLSQRRPCSDSLSPVSSEQPCSRRLVILTWRRRASPGNFSGERANCRDVDHFVVSVAFGLIRSISGNSSRTSLSRAKLRLRSHLPMIRDSLGTVRNSFAIYRHESDSRHCGFGTNSTPSLKCSMLRSPASTRTQQVSTCVLSPSLQNVCQLGATKVPIRCCAARGFNATWAPNRCCAARSRRSIGAVSTIRCGA